MNKIYNPYTDICGKNIFKGDLHFHSTRSDGKSSPQEMFDRLVCDRPSEHLSLDYKIDGYEGFIRFEAMDDAGHCAYTNPLYLGPDDES